MPAAWCLVPYEDVYLQGGYDGQKQGGVKGREKGIGAIGAECCVWYVLDKRQAKSSQMQPKQLLMQRAGEGEREKENQSERERHGYAL